MTSLPVRDSVSNYEKISRIGEGTYGVVCELTSRDFLLQPWKGGVLRKSSGT